jgi:hypothetical protein
MEVGDAVEDRGRGRRDWLGYAACGPHRSNHAALVLVRTRTLPWLWALGM